VVAWPTVRGGPPTVWSFPGQAGPRALAAAGDRFAAADGEVVSLYELRADPHFRRPAGRLTLPKTVHAVAFSADGSRMAVGYGSEVGVWDTTTGDRQTVLTGHRKPVGALAFAPDRPVLLTGSQDGTARVWDLPAGREAACYDWALGKVSAVAVSPDGLRAAAGGDGEVSLFDLG
jgi:WD40 repeat protein